MIDLNTIWFGLVGVLIAGYAILDGFDLGVGVIHLFTRREEDRKTNLAAIAPVWDGNEVWLLTAGGALFAAFPPVYASVFSGFYLAFMLLLAALIFRAVAIEFRGQVDHPVWKRFWDMAFGLGSLVCAVLVGVAFANILRGVPIDAEGEFQGTFLGLLNPYALFIGILSLTVLTMHGAIYLTLKTDGERRREMRRWAVVLWAILAVMYIPATFFSLLVSPFLFAGVFQKLPLYPVLLCLLVSIPFVPRALSTRRFGRAFAASGLAIASMIGVAGISMYPVLVPSSIEPAFSLTAYNASSTAKTLGVMLAITLLALPAVLAYTGFVYWVFRGRAKVQEEGY